MSLFSPALDMEVRPWRVPLGPGWDFQKAVLGSLGSLALLCSSPPRPEIQRWLAVCGRWYLEHGLIGWLTLVQLVGWSPVGRSVGDRHVVQELIIKV